MGNFIKNGNDIFVMPKGLDYDLEPGKVYDFKIGKAWGQVVSELKLNGEMNLPSTIYQTKKDKIFINRVINNFNKSDKNTTGVLLTGDKGTGKSVTAKLLAKEANLPIIIIDSSSNTSLLEGYFKNITTPVCILLDEVDKYFNTNEMLTFLDGLHKTAKKLVIMTANNEDNLSNFIKNRCSRIRYYRHYDMNNDAEEYAKLICENKNIENKDELITFIINDIKYPSIDNISSFIDEYILTKDLNITPEEVLEFMNINVGEKIISPKSESSNSLDIAEEFYDDDYDE